jgi:hypothetical protein
MILTFFVLKKEAVNKILMLQMWIYLGQHALQMQLNGFNLLKIIDVKYVT